MRLAKIILLGIFVSASFVSLAQGPIHAIDWTLENASGQNLQYRFYLRTGGVITPYGGDGLANLYAGETYKASVLCRPTQEICYGAWNANRSKMWGVGVDGRSQCTATCCHVCSQSKSIDEVGLRLTPN